MIKIPYFAQIFLNTTNNIPTLSSEIKSCVTIGSFDGLHKGHIAILKRLINTAKEKSLTTVVFSFFPHPRMVLQNDVEIKLLNTLEEKQEILEKLGVDYLVNYPFSKEFSRMTAEEFVSKILIKGLHTEHIIIGYDHRFGRNRKADINDLIEFGEQYHFDIDQIKAAEINAIAISSTKIRTALSEGDITTANNYLGYEYRITGTVVSGNQLGRTITFPTANIQLSDPYKLIPKKGVYIVRSIIDQKKVYGMMNIGTKPTVEGKNQSIEIHFFDFSKDVYGSPLSVSFLYRLRDEHKFESVAHLKEQLEKDKIEALNWLETKKA